MGSEERLGAAAACEHPCGAREEPGLLLLPPRLAPRPGHPPPQLGKRRRAATAAARRLGRRASCRLLGLLRRRPQRRHLDLRVAVVGARVTMITRGEVAS